MILYFLQLGRLFYFVNCDLEQDGYEKNATRSESIKKMRV